MAPARILAVDASGELADRLRAVVPGLPGGAEVTGSETLDPAFRRPFDVVVAGPQLATRAGLDALAALHDRAPSTSIVLAFAQRPRAPVRQLVRVGAVDYLPPAVDDRTVYDSIARAVTLATSRSRAATDAGRRGTVITVASASGGCGKTFFAVNAAYFLHHRTGGRACIVDLDLQFGEVVTALRLRPQRTIFDAQQQEWADDEDLRDHLEEYVVAHETGISVLPAPREPTEADRIDPRDVARIIDAARSRFDYVVVDTPPALSEVVLAALDVSDLLFVLTTLDVPSVRNLGVFLTTLARLKVPTDAIRLVMNKAESGVGIDVGEVARLFPGGFTAVLPYATVVSRAVNQGAPVLRAFPDADISRRLARALGTLLPADARHTESGAPIPPPARLRDRLRRRPPVLAPGGTR